MPQLIIVIAVWLPLSIAFGLAEYKMRLLDYEDGSKLNAAYLVVSLLSTMTFWMGLVLVVLMAVSPAIGVPA